MEPTVSRVTERIRARSQGSRAAYLARTAAARAALRQPARTLLPCGNLAHSFAACTAATKEDLRGNDKPNLAIVSAYNDMLSAHQPFERFPELIKESARRFGGVAQFAGGVPAMCDGITQGQPGMDLSLFSRDVIAMATVIALSHNSFDAVVCLGVCDKIVPGLLIGALAFGHLPAVFVPAGPMPSGLPNPEKSRIRQLFAEGKVDREALLDAESRSYHAPGTCTFYGTANTNQMLMEIMGLHVPGASFVGPGTALREALTRAAVERAVALSTRGSHEDDTSLAQVIDERAVVNGIVGLLATGGSTNHTIHLVAVARAAGIQITWDDFSDLSKVVPLLCRIYPNGPADVNHFHAAGGMAFLVGELLDAGLLHPDVSTVDGMGLQRYRRVPVLEERGLTWVDGPTVSGDRSLLRPSSDPFSADGGLRVLCGNLGRAVIKVSAVKPDHRVVEAPAVVFDGQQALHQAHARGALDRDCVVVVRFQGPRANGMPELHKLTPPLGAVQDRGFRVALVTDGRMSGASGKIPAAIHVSPECAAGGPLARVRDGDIIRVDAGSGRLDALVDAATWASRQPAAPGPDVTANGVGSGRELFAMMRHVVSGADQGATALGLGFVDELDNGLEAPGEGKTERGAQ